MHGVSGRGAEGEEAEGMLVERSILFLIRGGGDIYEKSLVGGGNRHGVRAAMSAGTVCVWLSLSLGEL